MLDARGLWDQHSMSTCRSAVPRVLPLCTHTTYQTCGVTSKSCVPKGGSATEKPVSCMVSRLYS
jgi:hypothetical protein